MNLSVASQILEGNPLGIELIYTVYGNSGSSFHPHFLFQSVSRKAPLIKSAKFLPEPIPPRLSPIA